LFSSLRFLFEPVKVIVSTSLAVEDAVARGDSGTLMSVIGSFGRVIA
jgi:hypothetical protein